MEARRCAEGSGLATLVGGGPATMAPQHVGEAVAAQLGEGSHVPRHLTAMSRWRIACRSGGEGRDRSGGEGRSRSL